MLKFLILAALIALLVYGLVRIIDHRGLPWRSHAPRPIPRPQGPDDDPDFLRDLDRKRRRRQAEGPDESPPSR